MPSPFASFSKVAGQRLRRAVTLGAFCALSAQADPSAETSAPVAAGQTATLDLEAQVRSEASNFATRLALPVVHQRTSATLVQVNAAKGAEDLDTIGGGLVQRFRPYGGEWVFGLYGFYELRESKHGAAFQQASFGLEASRGRHTLRANGWVPTTGGESRRHGRDTVQTGPTAGFDLEYELALPSPGLHLQPHLAAGYYYVEGTRGVGGSESGVKLRADVQYRWVTAGVEWREDDRAFGGNWLGTVRVTVPFGGSAGSGVKNDARMVEPIRRDSWPSTFQQTKHAPAPPKAEPRIKAPTSVVQPVPDQDCCNGAPPVVIYD